MSRQLILSVHQLVDFLLRTGDIDNRIYNRTSMSEGTKLHASYQRRQDNSYKAELYLSYTFLYADFEITVHGRADGVIERPFLSIIDEIKTSVIDNETFFNSQKEWHLGQARLYALMYAYTYKKEKMGVRLTYINQLTNEQLQKDFIYTKQELESYVLNLIKQYIEFYQMIYNHTLRRNESCASLTFPFKKFRKGQRELAKYVYGTISKGQRLYAEAPTGIGKTLSTLFPAIKYFSEEKTDKIFYLTAKNSGILTSFDAVKLLKSKGLVAKVIQITAKEKICLCPSRGCNPDECPYAKGYYELVREALIDAFENENNFSKETILSYAKKHQICPFEYQLDLALFNDIIVCDFNYLFDPVVYMRRFFDEINYKIVGLVDEAHNLVERGKEMYSTALSYSNFKAMKKSVKGIEHKKLKSAINGLRKIFKAYEEQINEEYTNFTSLDEGLISRLSKFQLAASDFMKKMPFDVDEEFKTFYFEVIKFIKISEFYDRNYQMFLHCDSDLTINLYNLDPSSLLDHCLNKLHSSILFSGTMTPLDYYVKMLGGNEQSSILKIASPFDEKNLKVMVSPMIATTFKKRDQSYQEVANLILATVEQKIGNYFIFFPSYKYLNDVHQYFKDLQFNTHVQAPEMSEEERQDFLSNFKENPSETHLGFVVLGGAFSEGIDLIGDRLIGAIIVGVGLPGVTYERDLIKDYFTKLGENGFEYAYLKPGMNRVMQAVGRVIRGENDKGIVLLIDERYLHGSYMAINNSKWSHYEIVFNTEEIKTTLAKFYNS